MREGLASPGSYATLPQELLDCQGQPLAGAALEAALQDRERKADLSSGGYPAIQSDLARAIVEDAKSGQEGIFTLTAISAFDAEEMLSTGIRQIGDEALRIMIQDALGEPLRKSYLRRRPSSKVDGATAVTVDIAAAATAAATTAATAAAATSAPTAAADTSAPTAAAAVISAATASAPAKGPVATTTQTSASFAADTKQDAHIRHLGSDVHHNPSFCQPDTIVDGTTSTCYASSVKWGRKRAAEMERQLQLEERRRDLEQSIDLDAVKNNESPADLLASVITKDEEEAPTATTASAAAKGPVATTTQTSASFAADAKQDAHIPHLGSDVHHNPSFCQPDTVIDGTTSTCCAPSVMEQQLQLEERRRDLEQSIDLDAVKNNESPTDDADLLASDITKDKEEAPTATDVVMDKVLAGDEAIIGAATRAMIEAELAAQESLDELKLRTEELKQATRQSVAETSNEAEQKPATEQEPLDELKSFTITLVKDDQHKKYGITPIDGKRELRKRFDEANIIVKKYLPEHLIIKRAAIGGLLEKWNEDHPDARVIPADRIVAVNGAETIAAMMKELAAPSVEIRIHRYPMIFEAAFTKEEGRKLGLRSQQAVNPRLQELNVTGLTIDGLVVEYNAQKLRAGEWHSVVLPNMRIISVNDVRGDAAALTKEMASSTNLRIRFRRTDLMEIVRSKFQAGVKLLKSFDGLLT